MPTPKTRSISGEEKKPLSLRVSKLVGSSSTVRRRGRFCVVDFTIQLGLSAVGGARVTGSARPSAEAAAAALSKPSGVGPPAIAPP